MNLRSPLSPKVARQDRRLQEHIHDTYKARRKLSENTVCPLCQAVFHKGRWQWLPKPKDFTFELCQACHRIKDQYPAGIINLKGSFLKHHKQEILQLLRNQEAQEKRDHPLHRIMDIKENEEEIVVRTTDLHLPRRMGKALQHAFKGTLSLHYDQGGCLLLIRWSREIEPSKWRTQF